MSKDKLEISKQQFIDEIENKLVQLFKRSKAGEKLVTDKAKIEGFMEAGKALNVITHTEGMKIMDKAHIQVFGESMAERKANMGRVRQAIETDDFEYLEIPAINRRQ